MDEREKLQMNTETPAGGESGFTLESILAEYKGSAFIDGQKRTPKEELDAKANRIIRELSGAAVPEAEVQDSLEDPASEQKAADTVPQRRRAPVVQIRNAYEIQRDIPGAKDGAGASPKREADVRIQAFSDMSEVEQEFFGIGKYARPSAAAENAEEAEMVIRSEERREARRTAAKQTARPREKKPEQLEEEIPEPTLRKAGGAYAKSVRPLKRRANISFFLTAILLYMCISLETGLWMPKLIKDDIRIFSLFSLVFLLAVMYFSRDVLIRGLADLFKGRAGAESLVAVAALAAFADAVYIAASGHEGFGAPFCVAAAGSMAFAVFGTYKTYQGFRRTYKMAIAAAEPYVVSPELDYVKDGTVLMKRRISVAGFVSRADEEDGAAHVYAFASPMLLIAALVLSLFSSAHGGMNAFFHNFAAMSAIAASFSVLLCYGMPFSSVAKVLSRAGAAIAGWSGACEIRDSVGVVITDKDIFPAGTMSLNGVRVFSGSSLHKVLSYTGSMVMASGSGLSEIFSELLRQQNCATVPVENFTCYEGGGIGASIRGERVLVGSSGFMNLMGVRVPQNLGVKTAVYTAISGELVGVFAVNYTPVNSVQHALVTLLDTRILPLLAVRDFNLTPMMIQQKFKITTDKLDYLTVEARYKLSEEGEAEPVRPVALLCREGLGPLAETVAAGRQFRSAVRNNVLITMIGTVVGILLAFYLSWNKSFDSLSALNLFLYLFAWMVPVCLVSGTVKRY